MPHGTLIGKIMRPRWAIVSWCALGTLLVGWLLVTRAAGQIVLSGLTTSFSKVAGADPMLQANQDRLTLSVLLTRGSSRGLFNAAAEIGYNASSPADTEWATTINNPGATIAATNYAALDFTTWVSAYGNSVGNTIVGRNAVLHIIPEDIYLDIRFTNWSASGSGGGFAYQRSKTPTGDYNDDGVVDAADYTIWRDTLGQSVATPGDGADGNLSGMIDAGDYAFWRAVYGEVMNTVDLGSGAGAAVGLTSRGATTLPEPTSLRSILIATFALVLTGSRPRRCSNLVGQRMRRTI